MCESVAMEECLQDLCTLGVLRGDTGGQEK